MLAFHFHHRHETFKTYFPILSKLHLHITCLDKKNPKPQTPISLLTLIDNSNTLQELEQIHAKSIILRLAYNQFILTRIIKYSLSDKDLDYAIRILDRTHEPDVLIYNSMIRSYSSSETPILSLNIYNKMRVDENVESDKYTFPVVLRACANLYAYEKGREVHGLIIRNGYDSDRFVQSSLLNFYSVCGEIGNARRVFDEYEEKDVVFWNAMIVGYVRSSRNLGAFEIFQQMLELKEMRPNEGTFLGLISACLGLNNVKMGREIHGYIMKKLGYTLGLYLGAALVDFYAKCGRSNDATNLFDKMPEKNTVVWNSLISSYSQNGYWAISLFREMLDSNVRPDKFTISGVLSACAQMGALNLGNWVRRFAEKNRIWDVFVGTALVDMYSKCGENEMAKEVFDSMPQKSVATWNSILSGLASHGKGQCTIDLFNEMVKSGAVPDSITFIAVLNACVHGGLVEKGCKYFDMMVKYYRIKPKVEHYGCMVDLFGRAGLLREAKELIERMEMEPNVIVWGALLSSCSVHGNLEIGEWAAQNVFQLDPMDGGSYILLSNLYAGARKFDRVKMVREIMAQRGVQKPPGCSMIEVGDVVHEFVVADKDHPRSEEIYSVLDELCRKMKMAEDSEKVLKWSERLAVLIGFAKAVHFLHTGIIPGFLNNRLKANNILLDEHRIAKLIDYGLSIITKEIDKLEAKKEGNKSWQMTKLEDDVYSFGFILLEMLIGPTAAGRGDSYLLNEMASFSSQDGRKRIVDPVVLTTCTQESLSIVISITNKCISPESSTRPSFEDVLWNLQYAALVQATADGRMLQHSHKCARVSYVFSGVFPFNFRIPITQRIQVSSFSYKTLPEPLQS